MNIENVTSKTSLTLDIDKNGVANLIFDLPNEKVNKLNNATLEELEKAVNVIDGNKAIRILLITSHKKNNFIAGADINEIRLIENKKDALEKVSRGQNILSKISKIKIPTIAVINGSCLGGGLELALACRYRVAVINPKTSLGLPEVNLGIIPGFGGTQRLPKIVGLEESLKMILSGKAIDAMKAYKIGLVDELIHEEFLEEKLGEFVSEIIKNGEENLYLNKRNKSKKSRFIKETILLTKYAIFYFAKKDLWEKTKGNYLAPFYALEVIKKTYGKTYGSSGYKIELEAFCELVIGETSKNLIEIFFTSESLKKDSGIKNDFDVKEIKNVGLLGAGVMGGGIAWIFAYNDFSIRIKDITQGAIAIGYNQVLKIFSQLKKIRKITNEQIGIKTSKITTSLDYSGFENVDFVVEAVVENISVKKNILSEVEKKIPKDAILVSNTSSLSISEMSEALENPDRFAGMHFFNPVNRMPLVEVIRGDKTDDLTIASVVKLTKKLGKTPIVVKDKAGFLVNRILLPYLNEASYLLQNGASIDYIDDQIEKFGMPMGPFVLADVVGIDVGFKVAHSLFEAFGERMKISEILVGLHNNHKELLGKKSKKGFYCYDQNGNILGVNKEIYKILNSLNIDSYSRVKSEILASEIVERSILVMINEASRCLEEKIVENARYLDIAMIMGTGFPAFRGGILRYADKIGIAEIVKKLEVFSEKYGKRFVPSDLLKSMSVGNQKFYQ